MLARRASPTVWALVNTGRFATVSKDTPCRGLWELGDNTGQHEWSGYIPSGGLGLLDYTSIATCPTGSTILSAQSQGLAEGPMQVQIFAPTAQALREATVQMTYSYSDPKL